MKSPAEAGPLGVAPWTGSTTPSARAHWLGSRLPPAAYLLVSSQRPECERCDDHTHDHGVPHRGRDRAEAEDPRGDHEPDPEHDIRPLLPGHHPEECDQGGGCDEN